MTTVVAPAPAGEHADMAMGPVIYVDRHEAGRDLAERLAPVVDREPVVVALSHGGVEVAAEIAHTLEAPLDMLVVRKIRYPGSPRRVLGAVAPGYAVCVVARADLTSRELAEAAERARAELAHVDSIIHAHRRQLDVTGRDVVLVDDGITTGARMITATRWARTQRARRIVAAVPLASAEAAEQVREEADILVCPHVLRTLGAVSIRYASFEPVGDEAVTALLERAAHPISV
jgi:putative phosphoribosyl transferase